jgi:excisionase family DNA binding protein
MAEQHRSPYLKIKDFIALSGLSDSTVRRRVRDGSLPAVQIGGKGKKLLIPADALDPVCDPISPIELEKPAAVFSTATPAESLADKHNGPRPKWMRKLRPRPK